MLLRAELCPVWRKFEKHLQSKLNPYMKSYAKKWRPTGNGYRFFYDHWVVSGRKKTAGKIKSTFKLDGSVSSTYAIVYLNERMLYKQLFTDEIHPAIIGGFIGRDMIHELRHQYQYSHWPQNQAYKLNVVTGKNDYLQRHTEIDAFATGAAFGYLMYGTCYLGKDWKNIAFMVQSLLSSGDGQKQMLSLVPELQSYYHNKDRYPREYRLFLKKSYKYFNILLDIHCNE